MPFDPDAFLASGPKKPPPAFDPDAFLGVKKDKGPSWGDALKAAPGAALDEAGGAIQGVGRFIASLPDDPLGYKIGRALKAAPGAIRDELGGMGQYIRNLSPQEFRGSAAELPGNAAPEAHPWLALGHQDTAPMRQAVAKKPLGLVADAAMVAGATAPGRAVLGKLTDLAAAPVRSVARGIADFTPERRSQGRLLEASRATPGMTPEEIARRMEAANSNVPGLYYSAAQASQDPGIAQLEKYSRIRPSTSPAWAQFDSGQNTALVRALEDTAGGATDQAVVDARTARDAVTRHGRQAAFAVADQGSMEPFSGVPHSVARENIAAPIRETVAREMEGAHGAAAGAERIGDYVARNAGYGSEPAARTYEARKTLADALNRRAGVNMSDIESSVKSADAMTRTLVGTIDGELNRASGGIYRQYMDRFIAESPNVKSMEALNAIREELASKIAGGATNTGEPILSRAYLKQIFERHGEDAFGPTILPQHQARLSAMLNAKQNIDAPLANYRAAVTGGGGSDTIGNALLTGAKGVGHAIGLGPTMRVLSGVGEGFSEAVGSAANLRLAELLQNPPQAARALREAAARETRRHNKRSSGRAALAAALAGQNE